MPLMSQKIFEGLMTDIASVVKGAIIDGIFVSFGAGEAEFSFASDEFEASVVLNCEEVHPRVDVGKLCSLHHRLRGGRQHHGPVLRGGREDEGLVRGLGVRCGAGSGRAFCGGSIATSVLSSSGPCVASGTGGMGSFLGKSGRTRPKSLQCCSLHN